MGGDRSGLICPIAFVYMIARPYRGLGTVLQTQLSQDGLHVHLYRGLSDDQRARNHFV